jgi:hypothetical protein
MPDLEFAIPRSRELKEKLRENLAGIFEFSPEDLAQNQAGKFCDPDTKTYWTCDEKYEKVP